MWISRLKSADNASVAVDLAHFFNTRLRSVNDQRHERAVANCLRKPTPECGKLLRANRRFLAAVERRRNQLQSTASLARYLRSFECPDALAFTHLCETDTRSRLIAAFHFGDFVYGMNYLMSLDQSSRRTMVLVKEPSCDAYFVNMHRAFGNRGATPDDQIPIDSRSMASLCSLLREKQINLVSFCDLPQHFGACSRHVFLGRLAYFPRGLATLAIRGGFPVLPVINFYYQGKNMVYLAPQIEPGQFGRQRSATAVASITGRLVRLLDTFVTRFPEQWRYLSILPLRMQSGNQQGLECNDG